MFTARNPRWWLRAAGAVGVVGLTAALLASGSARHGGQPRPGPGDGGADPRLDAAALAIAAVVSTAVLLLLRRPVTGKDADDREVGR